MPVHIPVFDSLWNGDSSPCLPPRMLKLFVQGWMLWDGSCYLIIVINGNTGYGYAGSYLKADPITQRKPTKQPSFSEAPVTICVFLLLHSYVCLCGPHYPRICFYLSLRFSGGRKGWDLFPTHQLLVPSRKLWTVEYSGSYLWKKKCPATEEGNAVRKQTLLPC